jgi:hypothetical protein
MCTTAVPYPRSTDQDNHADDENGKRLVVYPDQSQHWITPLEWLSLIQNNTEFMDITDHRTFYQTLNGNTLVKRAENGNMRICTVFIYYSLDVDCFYKSLLGAWVL